MHADCRLCGSKAVLRKSHILPEFVFRPTYDSSHTAIFVDQKQERRGKRQRGFTEYMLCDACEGRFNEWETYFANVWFNERTRLRPATIQGSIVQVAGLDYSKFKLFHLSLIWRSGISTLEVFNPVNLGKQETNLRNRLLQRDAGTADDYPFFGIAMRDPDSGVFEDRLLKLPSSAKLNGHRIYTMLYGGVLWHYVISSHAGRSSAPAVFEPSGPLTLGVQNWKESPYVHEIAGHLQRIEKRKTTKHGSA